MNVKKITHEQREQIEMVAQKFHRGFTEDSLAAAIEIELEIRANQALLAALYEGRIQAWYIDGQKEMLLEARTDAKG